MLTYYTYPKCSTCQKAKNWLDSHHLEYEAVHILEQTPSKEKLKDLLDVSGLEIQKLFNTKGTRYRELDLKDKIDTLSEEESLALLASDGMLLKRPITTDGKKVTVGFNEEAFEHTWLKV